MSSHPVRVPEEILGRLRLVAGLRHSTPGHVLAEAFEEYVHNHRDDLRTQFELTQKYVVSGDVDTILEMTQPARERRAKRAADRVSRLRSR